MTQPLEREVKPTKPHLKFIFCPHDERPELPDFLINEIGDRPYIFLEAVSFNQTANERTALEATFNLCLTSPDQLSPDQAQTRLGYLSRLSESKVFSHQLIYRLAGSDKKIFLIDADPGCEFFPLFEQVNYLRSQIFNYLHHNRFDLAGLAHQEYVDQLASLHFQREQLVHHQIKYGLVNLQANDINPRIAVIQGTVHSPTASLFTNDFVETESLIYPAPLPLEPSLWLKKRLYEPITDLDYLRALIIDFLFEDEQIPASIHIGLANYTFDQYTALLHEFDLAYHQHLNRITNRRRLTEEAKEPYLPIVYHFAVHSLLNSLVLRFS